MASRLHFIERIIRQISGGQPTDDSELTPNLVNQWLNDGIAVAAKQCYTEAIQIDGIGYVNGSFYTTFKGIAVTADENFIYKLTLPQLPVGIGRNEGVSLLRFKDSESNVSLPCIPISESQKGFYQTHRPIPNKVLFYSEGVFLYAISTIQLSDYTASVTMISGGDSTDLSSELNVAPDYFPVIVEYVKTQLGIQKQMPADMANDGVERS